MNKFEDELGGRLRHGCLAGMEDGGGMWGRVLPWLALLSFCVAVGWLLPLPAAALDRAGVAGFSREAVDSLELADRHAAAGRHFQAAKAYRHALDLGLDGADVRFRLSLALYGLGLIDEAVGEINQAQQLSPEANFLHLPTGILYLANGDLVPAAQQFVAALHINPGFADAYYYLGEVYYRQGDYQRAWLSCRMAQLLGHPGDGLQRKLPGVAAPPDAIPWRAAVDVVYLRSIPVASLEEGQSVLGRIAAGELFENIATERGTEASQGFGGYVGSVLPADLDPLIAAALLGREPFHPPVLLAAAGGFRVLQRIAPFDPDYWDQVLAPVRKPAAAGARTQPPAVTPVSVYRVHAGTYRSETLAQKQLTKLQQQGVSGYLTRQSASAGTKFHVIAGKFTTRQEALQLAEKLRQAGIEHYISGGK